MKELSLNILDLAQNSITAKAKNIKIEIVEKSEEKTMVIKISDDGAGMNKEILEKSADPFYTSRTTRKVGLGIPLFKMQAEMTGGSFEIDSKSGEGTVISAVFKTDSLDFVPLGDIISTLCVMISGSPETNFNFSHIIDDNIIKFDTGSLREALGEEISHAEPEVIEWIKKFLEASYEQ